MDFKYNIKCNIKEDQKLDGIIANSICTYGGVYEIIVEEILYDKQIVVFDIDQPCGQVMSSFKMMKKYVFETEEEANNVYKTMQYTQDGLLEYDELYW